MNQALYAHMNNKRKMKKKKRAEKGKVQARHSFFFPECDPIVTKLYCLQKWSLFSLYPCSIFAASPRKRGISLCLILRGLVT
jgi:hypothetical protein